MTRKKKLENLDTRSCKNQQHAIQHLKTNLSTITEHRQSKPDSHPNDLSNGQPPTIAEEQHNSSPSAPPTQQISCSLPTDNPFSILTDDAEPYGPTPENVNSADHPKESTKYQNSDMKTYTNETIIMCDSNGRMLNTRRLCPDSSCSYIDLQLINNS